MVEEKESETKGLGAMLPRLVQPDVKRSGSLNIEDDSSSFTRREETSFSKRETILIFSIHDFSLFVILFIETSFSFSSSFVGCVSVFAFFCSID